MLPVTRAVLLGVACLGAWCTACAVSTSDEQPSHARDDNFRLLTETYTIGRRYLASSDRGPEPPVDAWGIQMQAEFADDGASVLRSAGRDRVLGSRDDIVVRGGAKFRRAGPSGYRRPDRPKSIDGRGVL